MDPFVAIALAGATATAAVAAAGAAEAGAGAVLGGIPWSPRHLSRRRRGRRRGGGRIIRQLLAQSTRDGTVIPLETASYFQIFRWQLLFGHLKTLADARPKWSLPAAQKPTRARSVEEVATTEKEREQGPLTTSRHLMACKDNKSGLYA